MDRGEFLRGLGALPVALAKPADEYIPCGYLHANDCGGLVDHVTLDGRRITDVFETNDVDGWLRRYATDPDTGERTLRVEYLTGRVRVIWKERG
jgi:hypothetical protein